MVNLVSTYQSFLTWMMKMAGVVPYRVEIEPGTVMNFWVPLKTIKIPKRKQDQGDVIKPKSNKPVVVLIHGFAGDGMMTWQFQVGSLTKKYAVYVPDLLFFGGSITDNPDRSPRYQAQCLYTGLKKLGVEKCTLVGFSYGGFVAFKLAELYPDMVQAVVASGSVMAMTDTIRNEILENLQISSFAESLLPTSTKGLKELFTLGAHRKVPFPKKIYKDFLEVMINNRKEREELLEAMIVRNQDYVVPKFQQRIHFLCGGNDKIFRLEFAQAAKKLLGDNATLEGISKAGHLAHMERPCVYNRYLKRFLASVNEGRYRNKKSIKGNNKLTKG